MLTILKKSVVDPPKELQSPASLQASNKAASPEETMKYFLASNSNNGFSIGFMDKALLAYSKLHLHQMLNKGLEYERAIGPYAGVAM